MALLQPPNSAQNGCYTARQDRLMWSSLICDEGVDRPDSMVVSHPTASMSVVVGPGAAWVFGDDILGQGLYHVYNDADVTLPLASADPTDNRIDLIVVTVYDSEYTGSVDEGEIRVITGVSSPAPVVPGTPDDSIVLASVYVPAGTTGNNLTIDTSGRQSMTVCPQVIPSIDRDVYLDHARISVRGGGEKSVTTTGVSWTDRFLVMVGRDPRFAPAGYFDIRQPADGTIIPVLGFPGTPSVTVAGGEVPFPSAWCTLWYDLPLGSGRDSQSNRFYITEYRSDFQVPDTWVEVVKCFNGPGTWDTYYWADGTSMTPWLTAGFAPEPGWSLTSSMIRMLNGRRGYNFSFFSYEGTISSGPTGNISNVTVGNLTDPNHAARSYAGLTTTGTGGMASFYIDGTTIYLTALPPNQSLTNPSWSMLGVEL